ncbi:TPA: nuclear transport factor 2 family protein [Streptococcus pneumoniae]|uniref:Lipoprotein n=1 Tax=Streptococcus pneumoniae TaxID=1313 RepID=A0A916L514_STREE|nr:nuclear transport factor 2 family protein [Streptococcus pneumoniae]EGE88370.1 snoaL-like polyketide cyclase family protein [Streptococcus pneumoniae GA04375]EHD45677.1 snoaL-like polyketide cyclase family protein [Streptococcus pneumoniae GA49138]EHD84872.1 snoaL-like polyketide cyclase family protein [Streptococcus pneumoniae GA13455]EHD97347.1 snoaL-like polyketide cyclase family protein [Streptococcus pneumoniae GA16121]EHE04778.1 snoaL-like polyketide cyclase family protein [Streptococ
MSQQVKNAHNLYIHAIQDGRVSEAQAQSVGDTYIQHSTGVPDGKEGFAAFFADFFERHPERQIKIVRTIEDGNLVFVHVHQYLNGGEAQWVTTDTFRADENGRIVEHWDVIDYYRTPENDQLDQIFGDFEIKDLDKKAENKKLVRRFLTEIFQNGELEQWNDYVADDLIQHNHEIGQGSAAYKNYVAEYSVTFDFVFQLLGQGNYVVSYGQTQIDGVAYAQYDIFRLENGKIVEHWDNKEVMPKVEDLTNRGKF